MSMLTVSLTESMKEFVDSQVSARGFNDPSEYVRLLIERAQLETGRAEIDCKLIEGLEALERGDAGEMTADDWQQLRSAIRDHAGKSDRT